MIATVPCLSTTLASARLFSGAPSSRNLSTFLCPEHKGGSVNTTCLQWHPGALLRSARHEITEIKCGIKAAHGTGRKTSQSSPVNCSHSVLILRVDLDSWVAWFPFTTLVLAGKRKILSAAPKKRWHRLVYMCACSFACYTSTRARLNTLQTHYTTRTKSFTRSRSPLATTW